MSTKSLLLAIASLLLLPGLATSAAGDDEKEVRIERVIVDCAGGENCAEHHHARVAAHHGMGHHGSKSFLGVSLTDLTTDLKAHFGVPDDAGVMVSRVLPETAAARAGLQAGDIIAAVDGKAVSGARELSHEIARREPGETVQMEVWRGGKVELLSAALQAPPASQGVARVIKIECEEGEECDVESSFDCGGEEQCEVRVECGDDGECECTVNGEPADCEEIRSMHRRRG